MNESSHHTTSLFLSGVAIGAVLGAGIALLYAPQSGRDTRAYLSDKARELKDRTQHAFEKGKQVVREEAAHLAGEHKAI
jgi:gas vesicle protein